MSQAEVLTNPPTTAEEDDHEDDSAYADSIISSTASLSSSILSYRKENGRTFHAYKDGSYAFPNDEGENDQLGHQHHLLSLMQEGKLYQSPIDDGIPIHRVLDVGTGTGIWAIDFADTHPEAHILGIDLSRKYFIYNYIPVLHDSDFEINLYPSHPTLLIRAPKPRIPNR